jgi:hypothetical protein
MVHGQIDDLVVAQAVGILGVMPEVFKMVILPDVFVQAPVCTNPEVTVSIFYKECILDIMYAVITITGNGSWFQAVRLVRMELLMQGIETVKPVSLIIDPDLVKMILVNVRNPVFRGCMVAFSCMVHLELIPVIPVEPFLGAEPEKTQIIFKERGDQAMGEPVLKVDVVKTDIVVLGTNSHGDCSQE